MKRSFPKKLWILILIAIMMLPPLHTANAAGFNYYTSIYVHKNPDKMEYEIGESFNKKGMEIYGKRTKTDGSHDDVPLGLDNITVSPKQFTKAGKIEVEITMKCMAQSGQMEPFTTSLYVTVYDPNEGDPPLYWTKSISAEAKKTVYLVGESFDKSGLTVWAHSEGNVPPGEEKWDCTHYVTKISPTKFTKAGEQYVTVTANLTTEHSTADFKVKIKVKVYNKIEITKHPGGETVEEGGSCNFTVKGKYAETYTWYFVKDNTVIPVTDKDSYFPGLKLSGAHDKKLKLSHIPVELDGWSVMCEFSNPAHSIESDTASIQVISKGMPTPASETTPEPKDAPTETPTEAPSMEPVAEASATPEPVILPEITLAPSQPSHTHTFDGVYRWDAKQHWLECACGERTGVGDHVVTEWETVTEPTKDAPGSRKGHCIVCGAGVTESVPYEGDEGDPMSWLLILGIALAGVACTGCIVAGIVLLARGKRAKNAAPTEEEPKE